LKGGKRRRDKDKNAIEMGAFGGGGKKGPQPHNKKSVQRDTGKKRGTWVQAERKLQNRTHFSKATVLRQMKKDGGTEKNLEQALAKTKKDPGQPI